jgi:hypothetical protein
MLPAPKIGNRRFACRVSVTSPAVPHTTIASISVPSAAVSHSAA